MPVCFKPEMAAVPIALGPFHCRQVGRGILLMPRDPAPGKNIRSVSLAKGLWLAPVEPVNVRRREPPPSYRERRYRMV